MISPIETCLVLIRVRCSQTFRSYFFNVNALCFSFFYDESHWLWSGSLVSTIITFFPPAWYPFLRQMSKPPFSMLVPQGGTPSWRALMSSPLCLFSRRRTFLPHLIQDPFVVTTVSWEFLWCPLPHFFLLFTLEQTYWNGFFPLLWGTPIDVLFYPSLRSLEGILLVPTPSHIPAL